MVSSGHWPSLPERVGQLEALVESLVRENEDLREQVQHSMQAEEIFRRAHRAESAVTPMQMTPPPRKPAHKRDRHGLHLVTGVAAVAGGVWAWVRASRAHKAAALAMMAALGTTTAAVTPQVIPGAPAHAGPEPVSVRHHHQPTGAPVLQPSRKKRQPSGRNERNTPGPSPSPTGAAVSGGGSSPSPLPVVTPTPTLPLPSPTPTVCIPPPACHPLHVCCDNGDGDTQLLSDGQVTQTRVWLISKHRLRLAA